MARALIIGAQGQDGALLSQHLKLQGYETIGMGRSWSSDPALSPVSIGEAHSFLGLLSDTRPDEIYYLAAHHHSAHEEKPSDALLFQESYRINFQGLVDCLEAVVQRSPHSRVFYAASSHIFGAPSQCPQTENTPFEPIDIYGMSKLAGVLACRYYRKYRGTWVATGILYNHESHLRKAHFVSSHIIDGAIRIKKGLQKELVIGDLSAHVDWGYACDYVQAMHLMLQHTEPRDFVIASGVSHSIQDFIAITFRLLGMEWRNYVREDPARIKKAYRVLVGDASQIKKELGWAPTHSLESMITEILRKKGAL